MLPPRTKTKSEDLARIRNNQRRSRARRREYILQLERTVKEYEAANTSKDLSLRDTIQKLQSENEAMRCLLDPLGVDQAPLLEYLKIYPGTEFTRDVNFDIGLSLEKSSLLNHSLATQIPPTRMPPSSRDEFIMGFSNMSSTIMDANRLLGVRTLIPPVGSSTGSLDLLGPSDLNLSDIEAQLPQKNMQIWDQIDETTTLCSFAFRLVAQCNRRGLGEVELHVRMQQGYRKGSNPTGGCRIDNQVLLAVLAEIS